MLFMTEGEHTMSAARYIYIAGFLVALLIVAAFLGCSSLEPNRTGTAISNQAPEMFIVNIPPDGAQFSRNPELRWYATDKDGFIDFFRYSVVVESLMTINGNPVSPETFAANATDQQFGWDTLQVSLDNPQSMATVRLYANIDFPVDSFVNQYFFIQAQDDKGAKSEIKFRQYSRNNHYPNTKFRAGLYYINAKDASSPAPGINVSWQGFDSLDWGRATPPLEYEWRLYGPFEMTDPVYVKIVKENCIYDPTGDSFVACINTPVLDLDNLPQAVGAEGQPPPPQPLLHSEGPNYANDPTDVWVSANSTIIYDVFRDVPLDTTSQYKFIFWVRSRDDGYVPDPTPSFGQFPVYEAKFERPVLLLDETYYTVQAGRMAPKSATIAEDYWRTAITGAGYADSLFDTLKDYRLMSSSEASRSEVDFMDIFSHRIQLLYNDDVTGELSESRAFGYMWWVFQAMDMGGSAMVMARNLGGASQNTIRNAVAEKSPEFANRFGISQVNMEGWFHDLWFSAPNPRVDPRIKNEEFIGAYSNMAGFPNLDIDLGLGGRLDSLYMKLILVTMNDPDYLFRGLPEVGVGTRTQFAAPMYLYISKDGDKSVFNGKVLGVRQQLGDVRSACFMFTPLAMKQDAMQNVMNKMISWLEEKFVGGQSALKSIPSYNTEWSSIAARRARLDASARFLQEHADSEQLKKLGLTLPPFRTNTAVPVEKIPATQPLY
jgi:hypothetical protein